MRSSKSADTQVLETLLGLGGQLVKTGLSKHKCFGIFMKLAFPDSVLHGFGSVISHIEMKNAWRIFSLG